MPDGGALFCFTKPESFDRQYDGRFSSFPPFDSHGRFIGPDRGRIRQTKVSVRLMRPAPQLG